MKNYLKAITGLTLVVGMSCSDSNEIIETTPETPPVELSEEVEVYNEDLISNGLVLAVENSGLESSIIDKRGQKLFTWTFENKLGNDLELLPNGNVLGIFKPDDAVITLGGFGGIIRMINPNNSVDWELDYSTNDYIAHHDVELLPNGNVLFLVWERISAADAQAAGVNVTFDIFPEKLVEVDPSTNNIVWEWRSWDHIIQDFDSTKPNFGDVSNNPQLININYNLKPNGDIMHANGIDYDASKNVVYISVNFFSEVWVVDHSTSTDQAKTSNGGNFNKGGNLLYRFGNPEAYNNTVGKRLFYNNHYPNILENGEPGTGNLLIYVNGFNDSVSKVLELDIPDTFSLTPNADNEPPIVWSFKDKDLFFGKISGASRLSNGNTLICEGDYGFWEVTQDGEVAWKYNGQGTPFWRGYGYDLDDTALSNLGITF